MRSEVQREVDQHLIYAKKERIPDERVNYQYGANLVIADEPRKQEMKKAMEKDMSEFLLKALSGILTVIEA